MIFHQMDLFNFRNTPLVEQFVKKSDNKDFPSKTVKLILNLETIFQICTSSLINTKFI